MAVANRTYRFIYRPVAYLCFARPHKRRPVVTFNISTTTTIRRTVAYDHKVYLHGIARYVTVKDNQDAA
jgi:hypothetical protein